MTMTTNGDPAALARRHQEAGELAEAESLYQQALTANPQQADVWRSLGEVRQRLRKYPASLAAFQNAVRLEPRDLAACLAQAEIYKEQGRRDEAITAYRAVLAIEANHVQTWIDLGVQLAEQKRLDEAIPCWQRALQLQPDCARAVHNLGVALAQQGKNEEACRCLERALLLKPDYAEACFNLGNVLAAMKKEEDALERFREAIRLKPDYADAYINLGSLLTDLKRPAEGVVFLEQAVRLRPQAPEPHNQLGLALAALARYAEAEASYRRAVAVNPLYPEAHTNLGNAYQEQGRLDEALASYDVALCIDPNSVTTHWNRSLSLLQKGEFEQGWKAYEWRFQRKQTPGRPLPQPRWDGSPLQGRSILLYMEQGLGDMLMFIRYAALVKERGARVIVECPESMKPIFSRCPGIDELIAEKTPLPEFDVQAPLLSPPSLFGTSLANIPAEVPYLHPDEELVQKWREKLADLEGFRIGIVWQGNPKHGLDRFRSIALKNFAPLAAVPGVRLISLQHGSAREQFAEVSRLFRVIDLGDDLDKDSGAFMDSAAIMKSLDLVISVDTATAHLAGALAVPVWVPLCAIGEWRWLTEREDSPWYPTMRLFRQEKLGDWKPVFARMAREIEKLLPKADRASISVPISPGELLDKITILEIKSDRMTDPKKLGNINRELTALAGARISLLQSSANLEPLTEELKSVNEQLWEIEDEIRVREAEQDFGPRFVELARSVYLHNDHRAAIKREINNLLGSTIIEEKQYSSCHQDNDGSISASRATTARR